MLMVIGADIFTRYLLNFSFEVADELGGYMLVVMTFVSLSVCQANNAFHQVELVQARLSPRGRALSAAIFDVLSFALRVPAAVAARQARILLLSLRRARADLSGDAVVDSAPRHGDRRRGAAASRSSGRSSRMCGVSAGCRERMLGPELQIIIVTLIFLGLLTAGMAVPFAIAVPAVIYLLMQGGFTALNGLGLMSWGSMNTFALTAVPLFMFMADILSVSGLSNRIYNGLAKLVAPLPGGLLQTNIAGCAIFASVSGSSIATAASIGGVALPQLTSRNYHRALAAGSLAAGGTLGILIPPSFPMIIYGTFTETSVPKLFIAGVIPGLIMTALFMLYIGVHAKLVPSVAPKEQGARNVREVHARARRHRAVRGADRRHARRALFRRGDDDRGRGDRLLPVDPARLPCSATSRWKKLVEAMHSTVNFSGNILFLIFAAYVFSYAISFAGIGEKLTEFIVGMKLTTFQFYAVLFVLFTVLGCLIESLGMIVITVPLLFPILGKYGIDPILFGVILVIYIELGQISPPIGINLFVIQSIWDGKLSEVVYGTIPFHLIMFVVLVMVMVWPELALWLPQQMSGR